MADYTERPRPRHAQRYWYLSNGEVLREPTLLTTPAERRWAIEDDTESFWESELTGRLDAWAETRAGDKGTAVMAAVPNQTGAEETDWVKEKFLDDLNRRTGDFTPPETFQYGTTLESKFIFTNGPDAVVFVVTLEAKRSYYSGDRYNLSWRGVRTQPQHSRNVEMEDEPNRFASHPLTRALDDWEITDLLGEEWGDAKGQDLAYDNNEYVEAAAQFCRLSMQIADFVTIGDSLELYEAKWNPGYVSSLQDALKNEGPIKRLRQALEDMQSALQDMGFEVSATEDSEIYNLAANGGATPVVVRVHDKKEQPYSTMVIDFPSGRIHAASQTIKPDTLTLYEMAMKRAEREGKSDDLRSALALISGRKAFEDHEKSQRAVKTALEVLPSITPN